MRSTKLHNGYAHSVQLTRWFHKKPDTLCKKRVHHFNFMDSEEVKAVTCSDYKPRRTTFMYKRRSAVSLRASLFASATVPRRRSCIVPSKNYPGPRRSRSPAILYHQRLNRRSAPIQKPVSPSTVLVIDTSCALLSPNNASSWWSRYYIEHYFVCPARFV